MKLVKGLMSADWDIVYIVVGTKKIRLSTTSMGNTEYRQLCELQGIVIKDKFYICKEYVSKVHGKLLGYISSDELDSEFICITLLDKKINNKNKITVKRETIKNY